SLFPQDNDRLYRCLLLLQNYEGIPDHLRGSIDTLCQRCTKGRPTKAYYRNAQFTKRRCFN
ncbi:hypothetical protein COCVIDRAFT_110836, partial [Bipolaris victoriae FI3]